MYGGGADGGTRPVKMRVGRGGKRESVKEYEARAERQDAVVHEGGDRRGSKYLERIWESKEGDKTKERRRGKERRRRRKGIGETREIRRWKEKRGGVFLLCFS